MSLILIAAFSLPVAVEQALPDPRSAPWFTNSTLRQLMESVTFHLSFDGELCEFERIDFLQVASACPLHTAAETEHIVNEAARAAIAIRRDITDVDLIAAIQRNPAGLSPEKIENIREEIP